MLNSMKKISWTIFSLAIATLPILVHGQRPSLLDAPPGSIVTNSGAEGVMTLIRKTGGWLYSGVIAIAVVLMIYGGFLYVTSGGDEDKVKDAKNYIIYGAIGIAVATLATGIVFVVGEFLGAK